MGNGSICKVGRRARPGPARAPAGPASDPGRARPARPAGPGLPLPGPARALCRARLATPGPKRPNQQVEERGGPGEEKPGPANRPARARLRHIDRPAHSQPGPGRRVCRARFARGGPGEEKTGPAKARSAARERPLLTRPGPAGAPAGPEPAPPGPAPLTSGAPVISVGFLKRLQKKKNWLLCAWCEARPSRSLPYPAAPAHASQSAARSPLRGHGSGAPPPPGRRAEGEA